MPRISRLLSCLLLLPGVQAVAAEKPLLPAEGRWSASGPGGVPGFTRHVEPLLGRLGCSNRACHGSFQGQGGFRLSLFSSDPGLDHAELLEDGRLDLKAPGDSLALLKPTLEASHRGGKRFEKDGWEYRLLLAWIAAGAPYQPGKEASVQRLEVTPAEVLLGAKQTTRIRVVAHFSDGTREDVTGLTQLSTNDDAVAGVKDATLTALRPGDTALVATFGGAVQSVPVLVPLPGAGERAVSFPAASRIDELVARRLGKLGIEPSALCTNEEFLRRASLDITGTLPTPQEVRAFLADRAADKRGRKVDELLGRPGYVMWWTTKLCDLTGLNAPLFLGNTDFGPLVGEQWHRWLERRVRENAPYDRIVEGILLGTSRHPGESYDDYALRLSSYVKTKDPADFTAEPLMPHFWFRGNIGQPEEKALAVAYSFLGVRLECAQCHKHPFDSWTQEDFKGFAALFERVQKGAAPDAVKAHARIKGQLSEEILRSAASRRQTYWRLAREGKPVPWPEVYIAAAGKGGATRGKLLGGAEVDVTGSDDPRVPLMAWLRSPDNPYFAPALVNRIWAHYMGRGLVDPPDDFNLANPPSHPELLDYLARGFVASGYDMKWVHRTIATSRTYQLSWKPTDSNRRDERNYSHARIRRLPAEVAVDAVDQATAGTKRLALAATEIKGRRIAVQATADLRRTEYGLAVFGKPLRVVACDCERETDPSLLQAVYLRNDPDVARLLDRKDGWLAEIPANADPEALIEEAYLRTLSRLPDAAERARCRRHLKEVPSLAEGMRDLMWALLNTQEFITCH